MKKYLKILYFIVPILIGIIFANGLNIYLNHEISVLMQQKDLMPIKNKFGDDLKSKGVVANDYFLNQKDIMFLGSSELRHVTLQHPSYFFNSGKSKNEAFIEGKQFNQDLQAATIIGSLNPDIKDKKVVFTFSFQWFLSKEGNKQDIKARNYVFSVRFSPAQFYQALDNPKITPATKKELAQQVFLYLRGTKDYQPEVLYAKMYGYDSISSKVERVLFYPYFVVHKFMVQLNGKGLLYKELKTLPEHRPEPKKIVPWDWEKQRQLAHEDGKRLSTNNPFGMLNTEYTKGFVANLPAQHNIYAKCDLLKSNEMKEYKLFLQVCKETGVKPIIVLMPGMNWFYNYAGVPKEERTEFFNYIQKLAEDDGFTVLNYEQYDTQKYFLRDPAHLGTEGWTDVCEKVYKIYNQQ